MSEDRVYRAQRCAAAQLFDIPGVTSVRVGYKTIGGQRTSRLAVVVGVERKIPREDLRPEHIVPPRIDDVETDVVETGRYYARSGKPILGGSSVGHVSGPTGTLGAWMQDAQGPVMLSNAHVIAATNDGKIGDAVLSPGPVDGGSDPTHRVALLAWSTPIVPRSHGENRIDAALARPLNPGVVTKDIRGLVPISRIIHGELGMLVWKSGRTTGVTEGEIIGVGATVDVWYDKFVARFVDQYIISPGTFARPGDSGSVVVANGGAAVGLLFAGSTQETIASPMLIVAAKAGVVPLDVDGQPPEPPIEPPVEPPPETVEPSPGLRVLFLLLSVVSLLVVWLLLR